MLSRERLWPLLKASALNDIDASYDPADAGEDSIAAFNISFYIYQSC